MLRAGIIGLGIGERHMDGYESGGRAKVVALCDIDPAKLDEVAGRHPGRSLHTDYRSLLAEVDVVSIASYDDVHARQIVDALDAGKHVFAEKPLCLHEQELADIRAALARNPGCRLSSNLILRRSPRFMDLRARIRAGEFGTVFHMEGDYNYGRLHKLVQGWRGRVPGYSVTLGGGLHMIDLLMWLLGERPDEVTAYGGNLSARDSQFAGDDLTVALLRFPSGCIAKVASNYACVLPHHHNVLVYGSEATFEQTPRGAVIYSSRDPTVAPRALDTAYPGMEKGELIPSFLDAILHGGRPEIDENEVLDGMAVALAVDRAIREARPIRVGYGE